MVALGSDSHKRTRSVVAVDVNGRQLGSLSAAATSLAAWGFEQRMAEGDTKTETLRTLRRRISDEACRRLRQDHLAVTASPSALAA